MKNPEDDSAAQERRTDAKGALLSAASELFAASGYAAVSTREIAERAGVNLGAIQYHFGSKAQLFVAVVHHLMRGSDHLFRGSIDLARCHDAESAARQLCRFIHTFLAHQLCPDGPQACRVMCREIFSDTAEHAEMFESLVQSTTDAFLRPLEDLLVAVIRYLRPQASLAELQWSAHSIVGQCAHYMIKRPFIERLRGGALGSKAVIDEIASHLCRFTLRGFGCSESLISRVLDLQSDDAGTATGLAGTCTPLTSDHPSLEISR